MSDMQSPQLSWEMGATLLLIFGLGWIGLGLYWGRKAKDLDGFMLAGRNVGMALGSATCMATWVTSNTVMLAPVFALEMGIWGMLAYCTASFGLFLFAPMAHRIRQLTPRGYTSGDFMRIRYGQLAWKIFLVISLVYSMAWLVSMAMAGGKLMLALSGIPYEYGMSAILLVCVIYTLFGGLYAVIGTDFIQSIIILVGIVIVGATVLFQTGIGEIHESVATYQPALLDLLLPVALLAVFNNMFFGFGEVFHNNVWWSRALAMRQKVAHKAFFLSGFLWFPIPIAAGFIGLCALPLGINIPDPDMAGPLVASHVLGATGSILVFIVLFCSLASSIDSLLAATSDLLTEDVFRKMICPDVSNEVVHRATLAIIIGLGFVTWLTCLPRLGNIIEVLFLSGPLVASTIWPIITGLYWKSANREGAIMGMLMGSLVGLWAYWNVGWFVASLIGAVVSMLFVVLMTWLIPQTFDWKKFSQSKEGSAV